MNDHGDAWEVVRRADRPDVGLILDSFDRFSRKIDPDTLRSIPGVRVFFVQLADAPAIDIDLLYWSRLFRNMPGKGDLEVRKFMQAVMATGNAGPISLEIFNDRFRSGPARQVAVDGERSLIYLMDDVRRAELSAVIDLPQMPARVGIEGTPFIEFASRATAAEALETLLRTLGLGAFHRHEARSAPLNDLPDRSIRRRGPA